MGGTHFVGTEFRIFLGYRTRKVCSSVLVDKPEFRRVQSSGFPDFGLGLACFWPNMYKFDTVLNSLKVSKITQGLESKLEKIPQEKS